MDSKVGVLTFVWSRNYGAILQAWALQAVISSLGFDCELINFRRNHDRRFRQILSFLREGQVVRSAKEFLIELLNWRKHSRFNAFRRAEMRLSPRTCLNCGDLQTLSDQYDVMICGSDQVWNTELTQDAHTSYLLDFPANEHMLRIAYAASIGKESIDSSMLETFSRCLKRFDAISIREKSASDLIKSLACRDISAVLDPSLLLTMEEWTNLSAEVRLPTPYLLVYSFGSPPALRQLVDTVAEERGLNVVTFHKRRHYRREVARIPSAGPREFLGAFSKANFVITNSFHGTAFSIVFKKQFLSVATNNKSSRLRDLLDALDLGQRLVVDGSMKDLEVRSPIDYAHAEVKLSDLRKHSIAFLNTALHTTKTT